MDIKKVVFSFLKNFMKIKCSLSNQIDNNSIHKINEYDYNLISNKINSYEFMHSEIFRIIYSSLQGNDKLYFHKNAIGCFDENKNSKTLKKVGLNYNVNLLNSISSEGKEIIYNYISIIIENKKLEDYSDPKLNYIYFYNKFSNLFFKWKQNSYEDNFVQIENFLEKVMSVSKLKIEFTSTTLNFQNSFGILNNFVLECNDKEKIGKLFSCLDSIIEFDYFYD